MTISSMTGATNSGARKLILGVDGKPASLHTQGEIANVNRVVHSLVSTFTSFHQATFEAMPFPLTSLAS
jgi:hypothetical protein